MLDLGSSTHVKSWTLGLGFLRAAQILYRGSRTHAKILYLKSRILRAQSTVNKFIFIKSRILADSENIGYWIYDSCKNL